MGIGGIGGSARMELQLQTLQQQVAELQKALKVAQENFEAMSKLTDTWAAHLSTFHKTRFPTLQKTTAGMAIQKLVIRP
jgi:hypothetical protein